MADATPAAHWQAHAGVQIALVSGRQLQPDRWQLMSSRRSPPSRKSSALTLEMNFLDYRHGHAQGSQPTSQQPLGTPDPGQRQVFQDEAVTKIFASIHSREDAVRPCRSRTFPQPFHCIFTALDLRLPFRCLQVWAFRRMDRDGSGKNTLPCVPIAFAA